MKLRSLELPGVGLTPQNLTSFPVLSRVATVGIGASSGVSMFAQPCCNKCIPVSLGVRFRLQSLVFHTVRRWEATTVLVLASGYCCTTGSFRLSILCTPSPDAGPVFILSSREHSLDKIMTSQSKRTIHKCTKQLGSHVDHVKRSASSTNQAPN
jgi:hypothetical protein